MTDWEHRLADLWASIDTLDETVFLTRMEQLTGELRAGDAVASFERGAAFDSTGHPERAVPRYRRSLAHYARASGDDAAA